MDLPPEILADLQAADRDQDKHFRVWRPVWPIFDAFLMVRTQWRQVGMVDGRIVWQGLDYAAVDRRLERAGIALTPSQWEGLQTIEREAARVLNAR